MKNIAVYRSKREYLIIVQILQELTIKTDIQSSHPIYYIEYENSYENWKM
jgi:hypothetical protein